MNFLEKRRKSTPRISLKNLCNSLANISLNKILSLLLLKGTTSADGIKSAQPLIRMLNLCFEPGKNDFLILKKRVGSHKAQNRSGFF